jgi:RimJ/RimL family protein N-acetyltransferase
MGHVALRPVQPGDLDQLFEQQRDAESVAMAGVPAREREAFDAHWERILNDPESVIRAVLADGELAGSALSWRGEDGRRLIGYWIDRGRWGRGIATAALGCLLEELEERPLYAITTEDNAASQQVLTRNGFVEAGDPPQGERHFRLD